MIGIIDPISTMSTSRVYHNMAAIQHVADRGIIGDIVEFGVYMGGNLALFAHECHAHDLQRDIWAYDTFEGVPYVEIEPIDNMSMTDDSTISNPALRYVDSKWCYCDIDQVRYNVHSALRDLLMDATKVDALANNIRYVKGSVLNTVPAVMPEAISFVRLDMDIAQPTKHVIGDVWDRLSVGGIMHVDDYNTFSGVHSVIDEFVSDKHVYIHEIDYTAISIVRLA